MHNDYKLDNMLLDGDDPAVITALLDWDMCTLGDPLVDLGYMLVLWPERDDPKTWRATGMPTWRDGFPSRAEATARYATKTGFDVAAFIGTTSSTSSALPRSCNRSTRASNAAKPTTSASAPSARKSTH